MIFKFSRKHSRRVQEAATGKADIPPKKPDRKKEKHEGDQQVLNVACSSEEEQDGRATSSSVFYQRLRDGLVKTRRLFTTDIDQLFSPEKQISPEMLDDLEERLITADIGVKTSMEIIKKLSGSKISDSEDLKNKLKNILLSYLQDNGRQFKTADRSAGPQIILVVGVNGVGKTTTIGKLAAEYVHAGKKVMLIAADTFRAAAIEQLEIWSQRTGADLVKHRENSDPAAVVFDGLEAAQARGVDIVLIDTAGRLHTQTNLMEELKKIKRTIARKISGAPHEVLLVLDATTGQNALSQAEMFIQATGVTGIALTKLDGTAKGGIVVNLCHTFHVPLRFIGIGEQAGDLQPFEPEKFVAALF